MSGAGTRFEYWADGILVTTFEPHCASYRVGSEPDRFLDEMRLVGLIAGADDEEDEPESDLIAALNLSTFALGIWWGGRRWQERAAGGCRRRGSPEGIHSAGRAWQ
jgi:Family of unknown function (DUF6461)